MPKPQNAAPLTLSAAEVAARLKKEREVHWYALYVSTQHERKIAELLQSKNMEAFVPTRKEKHRWSDRMKIIEVVLTPSIVFVRNSMATKNDVFVTKDVKSYYYAPGDNKPSPIPDASMEDFMRMIDSNYEFKVIQPVVGDDVMVMRGPLKGIVGNLVKIDGDQQFVIRLNDAFSAAVKIDPMDVNKVPKGTLSLPADQVPNKMS